MGYLKWLIKVIKEYWILIFSFAGTFTMLGVFEERHNAITIIITSIFVFLVFTNMLFHMTCYTRGD